MDNMILDESALARISTAVAELGRPVELELRLSESAPELGQRLALFADQLSSAGASMERLVVNREATGGDVSELVLRADGRAEIRYLAVPTGPELPPFLLALAAIGGPESTSGRSSGGSHELDVFISPDCPNCPRSVAAAVSVCAVNPQGMVRVIDATAYPDLAAATGVRSVPMIVSDTGLTLVGALDAAELAEKLAAARGGDGDAVVFGSLVDAGRFGEAAALLSSPGARETFVDRWQASALEGRIGLALTADEALAIDSGALDDLVAGLIPLLAADSAPLRGDTAELLGKIGHPAARTALERLLDDGDEDVAEIAADALEDLAAGGRAG
jgi:hypothetical protein